jgi:hypothetical protein
MMLCSVQTVQVVQAVQTRTFILRRVAGEERGLTGAKWLNRARRSSAKG